MSALPASPFPILQRPAAKFAIWISDDSGVFPDDIDAQRVRWLLPVQIDWRSEGPVPFEMLFQIDLAALNARYQDIGVPTGSDRVIEVRKINPLDATDLPLVGWGRIDWNHVSLSRESETSTIRATIDELVMGGKLEKVTYWDGFRDAEVEVRSGITFNPLVDDLVSGNMSNQTEATDGWRYPIDRESIRTLISKSSDVQDQTASRWTLAEAVFWLCWNINHTEPAAGDVGLINPEIEDLREVFDTPERDALLINHTIERGTSLPDALDDLLSPYGYGWQLRFDGEFGSVETSLAFFELGDGITKQLRIQRLGSRIDPRETDVDSLELDYNISQNPNVVKGSTAVELREITIPLVPAWDRDHDPDTDDYAGYTNDYDILVSHADYQPGGTRYRVGRKWAVGEAGDYYNERTSTETIPDLFSTLLKRRKFLPCLTRGADGQVLGDNGYVVRIRDSADRLVDCDFEFDVLDDELGIMLTGVIPPELWQLYQDGITYTGAPPVVDTDTYTIDITATVALDNPLTVTAERQDTSPSGRERVLLLDLSERFNQSFVQWAGDYKSRYYDERHLTLTDVTRDSLDRALLWCGVDADSPIVIGQRVAVLTDQYYEGVYTVAAIDTVAGTIRIEESISQDTIDEATADGDYPSGSEIVALNTNEEESTVRLTAFVEQVRNERDYAFVGLNATLSGVDHPQYPIGTVIDAAQPRNVTFNGRSAPGTRAPQVRGVTWQLSGGQRTVLQLEQVTYEN